MWIRSNEFHKSLETDYEAMLVMDHRELALYFCDLTTRRRIAHKRELKREDKLLAKCAIHKCMETRIGRLESTVELLSNDVHHASDTLSELLQECNDEQNKVEPGSVDPSICKHPNRNMNGGCDDCGDPCL